MRVLLGIPHIFDPKEGSVYSSQNEEKRSIKIRGLQRATTGNILRFNKDAWVCITKQPYRDQEVKSCGILNYTLKSIA